MKPKAIHCWDSGVFLAWLLPEPERKELCEPVIRAAESGAIRIVTSAIALTEVIHLKGHPKISEESSGRIKKFFQHEYIVVRNVDRFIAEHARELIWRHGLKPKDSIHAATAAKFSVDYLDTFDVADFSKLKGVAGFESVKIGEPGKQAGLQGELKLAP